MRLQGLVLGPGYPYMTVQAVGFMRTPSRGGWGAEVELWLHLESMCLQLHPSRGSSIYNSHKGYGPTVSLWRALQTLAEGSLPSRAVVLDFVLQKESPEGLGKTGIARSHH